MNLAQVFGNEVIARQTDSFVDEAVELIDRLTSRIETYNINGLKVYKNESTLSVVKDIEKLLTKRFGLTTVLAYGGKGVAAYVKTPPNINNGLDEDFDKVFDSLKKSRKTKTEQEYIEEEHRKVSKTLWTTVSHQQEKLIKYAKKFPIEVDRKNAVIKGVPKDIKHFILMDWGYKGYEGYKKTSRELLAILIHEIGHAFTFHEYSARNVKNTIGLVEAFMKIKTQKDFEKTLVMVAKEHKIDLKDTPDKMKVIKVTTSLIEQSKNNVHYYKDAEALADQFATRFGLGADLSIALTKITDQHEAFSRGLDIYFTTRIVVYSIVVGMLIGGPTLALIYMVGGLAYKEFLTFILNMLITMTFSEKTSKFDYDNMVDRLDRIRKDTLRQINYIDETRGASKELTYLVEDLDVIKEQIIKASRSRMLSKILADKISSSGKLNYSLMEKTLESLEANPLVALKLKLEKVKDK